LANRSYARFKRLNPEVLLPTHRTENALNLKDPLERRAEIKGGVSSAILLAPKMIVLWI